LTMQPIQFNSVAPPNIPKIDLIRWQVCRSFLPSNSDSVPVTHEVYPKFL